MQTSINKELLADIDVTPPRGTVKITWHLKVLQQEMQAARNVGFIQGNYTENVNIWL